MNPSFPKNLKLYLLLFLLISAKSFALSDKRYEWSDKPERHTLTAEEEKLEEIVLKNYIGYEYVYESGNTGLVAYHTIHKVLRVNNDEAIQKNNKIYISMYNVIDIVDIKARSINKNGKIIELDKNNIKETKDEKEGSGYRIFAIEGVEKESEIEYYYVKKTHAAYFGREYMQTGVKMKNLQFEVTTPENLYFDFKSYNGFPDIAFKQENGRNIYKASVASVDALKDEQYASYNAGRMRVEFKLMRNSARGNVKLFTWADAAKSVYENSCVFDKKDLKDGEVLLKKLKIARLKTEEEKIREIENYIKTSFVLEDIYSEEFTKPSFIIANKYANKRGIVNLFCLLFKSAGIKYEVVLTLSRKDLLFDGSFESYNYLSSYLIHFPQHKTFLSPSDFEYRYKMVPYEYTGVDGLFIRTMQVGDFETPVGEIKHIPTLSHQESTDNMDINFRFTSGMDALEFDFERSFGGYNAMFLQPYFNFIDEVKRTEILQTLVKSSSPDAEFIELSARNYEKNVSPLSKPFIIKAKFRSSSLIENAGKRYLLKIGEVIGPQVELYQEGKRDLDVMSDYNRGYHRKISFEIPEGYIIKNLEDINMDVHAMDKGKKVFNFNSSYTRKGNQVNIVVEEYYDEIYYPKEKFEDFRKVINAAADFNKIVLVFEKDTGK